MAAADAQKTNAKSFSEFLKASGIDIGEIVRQQFTEQLKHDPLYGPRFSTDGSYRFVLEVPSYGINKTHTFSSQWVPNLRIDYKLLSPESTVLAEDWAMTLPFTDLPKFTTEDIKANPQVLKQAFEKAAAGVAAKLMKR